jgi:hypothetical protein
MVKNEHGQMVAAERQPEHAVCNAEGKRVVDLKKCPIELQGESVLAYEPRIRMPASRVKGQADFLIRYGGTE